MKVFFLIFLLFHYLGTSYDFQVFFCYITSIFFNRLKNDGKILTETKTCGNI